MTGEPLRSLASDFRAAPEKLREQVGQVVRKTALDVQNSARNRAPVDTGFLRSSINNQSASSFGGEIVAQVTPTANYAVFQEHGTSRGVPAVGFMSGAADDVRDSFEAAVRAIGGSVL